MTSNGWWFHYCPKVEGNWIQFLILLVGLVGGDQNTPFGVDDGFGCLKNMSWNQDSSWVISFLGEEGILYCWQCCMFSPSTVRVNHYEDFLHFWEMMQNRAIDHVCASGVHSIFTVISFLDKNENWDLYFYNFNCWCPKEIFAPKKFSRNFFHLRKWKQQKILVLINENHFRL